MRLRLAPLALVVLVLAGCGGGKAAAPEPKPLAFAGSGLTPPVDTTPFALHDQDGKLVRWTDQRGRFAIVAFLYTHCPDVCPLIASNLNTVLRTLGPKGNVEVLAVRVDPKGDTAAAVRTYEKAKHLQPAFHYLIGTRAQLRPVWAAWHVLAVDRKPDLVDHVAYTALVDPAGKRRVLYDAQVNAQQVLHDLRLLKKQRA
jgi:protein SCO1